MAQSNVIDGVQKRSRGIVYDLKCISSYQPIKRKPRLKQTMVGFLPVHIQMLFYQNDSISIITINIS